MIGCGTATAAGAGAGAAKVTGSASTRNDSELSIAMRCGLAVSLEREAVNRIRPGVVDRQSLFTILSLKLRPTLKSKN